MIDFFGNELAVGDEVAFCKPGYRYLISGKIQHFTPQKVRVEYKDFGGSKETYLGEPNFFIKKMSLSAYDSVRATMGKEAW